MVSMNIAEFIFVGIKFSHLKSKCLGHSHLKSLGLSSKDLQNMLLKPRTDFSGGEHNVLSNDITGISR